MNPIIRYIARRADQLMLRGEYDGESVWLFNPIIDGRRRHRWIPLSVRLVEVTDTPAIELSGRGELIYVLRGWFTIRHYSGIANHYARYKEGDQIQRRRWDGMQITTTSASRRQQALYLGIVYGF